MASGVLLRQALALRSRGLAPSRVYGKEERKEDLAQARAKQEVRPYRPSKMRIP